jgi:hypothetical protein
MAFYNPPVRLVIPNNITNYYFGFTNFCNFNCYNFYKRMNQLQYNNTRCIS